MAVGQGGIYSTGTWKMGWIHFRLCFYVAYQVHTHKAQARSSRLRLTDARLRQATPHLVIWTLNNLEGVAPCSDDDGKWRLEDTKLRKDEMKFSQYNFSTWTCEIGHSEDSLRNEFPSIS